jgi:hypothetical protein
VTPRALSHAALAARLDAAADRLTARVLEEMYADPFWRARFGERAAIHGTRDGRYHIDYLIQALTGDDVAILEQYARWLQPVLTSRGMCTRHLAENFARLARAIADEAWPDAAPAVAMLAAAERSLAYPPGSPARAVRERAAAVIAAALARDPELVSGELDTLLHHAADALALADPAVFARHVTWLRAWPGAEPARLEASLRALAAGEPAVAALLAVVRTDF